MSSGKGIPSHFWNRNIVRSILPGLWRKRTGLLLSGPKSSFQIKVNFAFHLEIKVWSLEEDCRGTKSKLLEVQCEVSEVSGDLGCRDICWCWSIVFYQVQSQYSHLPWDFRALYASICWQALWFADHDNTVLDWPANMPGLNPIWNLWDIFKRKMRNSRWYRRAEGSIVPQQCHRLIAYMPHLTDAGICAKGATAKYWVHKWTYFKELELFYFANPFFLLILGNILIFWDTDFWLSLTVSSNHQN